MPLRPNAPAPYGPPAGVLAVVDGYRNRGLSTPFTPEVLLRLGVSESLVPRVIKSLEGLDLIDKDGNPTSQLEGLRRATTDEFPTRLAEVVRVVYADVFNFADPTKDSVDRIADAFRAYEPIGQRGRMVTLFMGLCEAAGIIKAANKKPAPATPRPATGKPGRSAARPARDSARGAVVEDRPPSPPLTTNGNLPPVISGMLAALPSPLVGWTTMERDSFVSTFQTVLNFAIPIRDRATTVGPDEPDDEE